MAYTRSTTLLWAAAVLQSTFVVGVPTWPAPSTDELEDIMFLSTGHRARNFAAPVTPCAGAGGPGRVVGAEWVRTAFHDMTDYGVTAGKGGLDGSIVYELSDSNNAGAAFNNTLLSFEPFYGPQTGMADLIALGLYTSVRSCGGPIIPVKTGRVDANKAGAAGGVPQPQNAASIFQYQFQRMGFNTAEMIGLVACGHTLGGVHASVNPINVPPGSAPNDFSVMDSTSAKFDSMIATEYIVGNTTNPLVVGPGVAKSRNSDTKVYSSDRNVTINQLRDPSVFQSTCQSLLQRMIQVVPDAVTLSSDTLTAYEAKPYGLQLYLQDGGQQLAFSGEIRIRTTNRPASSIANVQLVYKDRTGGSNCNGCTINTQSAGTANGLDEAFSFYSFTTKLPTTTSISSFNVLVTYTNGNTETLNNNGGGFPVQDTLLFQSPQSCTSTGGITITAAVRNTTSGTPNVNLVVKNYVSGIIRSNLATTTTSMSTSTKQVGGYNIFNVTISVSSAQASSARYSVTLGGNTIDYQFVSSLSSQCASLSAGSTLDATYLGCFTDSVSQRTLSSAQYYDSSNMSIESCAAFCKSYNYFGTEYSAECYCGNTKPTTSATETDCNMACSGNANELCGAGNRLSVYTNTKYTAPSAPSVSGWSYRGCYTDSVNNRTLPDARLNDNQLTLEECANFCASGNFTNFGTEYSGECYCANQIGAGSTSAASTDCNMACGGNSAQMCGGPNRLSLFSRQTTSSKAKRHLREHLHQHVHEARHQS